MASLNIIPYGAVEAALSEENESLREQREYNTTFHTREEITAVLPNMQHFGSEEQPWILLSPWLDLIMSSRGLAEIDVHRILLPGTFLIQLIHASQVGLHMHRISGDDAEDLAAAFPTTTTRGDHIEDLLQHNRFFVRLDACSLKDAHIGQGPIKNVRDLWMRLATSARGMTGIRDLRKLDISTPIYMYLFPWQDDMRTELEYRVYCAPPTGRIAAISQYKWHTRWYHADAKEKHEGYAERLMQSCGKLHEKIMTHPAMTSLLESRGFVFDVVEDPDTQNVTLIELNDFGAMSGCGACLFHWIRDAKVMYGMNEKVEVRVAV